jgi:tetratricopeptide (TPR) repeat protein
MIHLGDQLLRRLRARHDPARAEAEWLRLCDDLMTMLLKELVPMAQRIEGQAITPFAVAAMHQQLGDLVRQFGQGEEALRQYRRGYELIDRFARAHPENDVARANLGVFLLRLGETALDLDGDARCALSEYRRAWDLQEQIARQPRSGQYTAVDNRRILSHIAIKLGVAELSLGHATEARDHFRTALSNRLYWTQVEPENLSARSFLSEAEFWLGVASSHLDDWPAACDHFDQAIGICDELARRFSGDFNIRADLAGIFGEYGAALARHGECDRAEMACRRSLQGAEAVLAHDPEDLARRLLMATAHERLAALALRRGKPADAECSWRAALAIRAELAPLEPRNLPRQAELALALARCGRCKEALRKAEELLPVAADRPALLLPLARCFAACAARETDADRSRDVGRMLDALGASIRQGYRDAVVLRTDSDFAPFRVEPAFRSLVDGLGARP